MPLNLTLLHFRCLKMFSLVKPKLSTHCVSDSNNPLQSLIALTIYGPRLKYFYWWEVSFENPLKLPLTPFSYKVFNYMLIPSPIFQFFFIFYFAKILQRSRRNYFTYIGCIATLLHMLPFFQTDRETYKEV